MTLKYLRKSSFFRLIALLVVYAAPLFAQDGVQSFLTIWNIKRFFCVALYSVLSHEEKARYAVPPDEVFVSRRGTCSRPPRNISERSYECVG